MDKERLGMVRYVDDVARIMKCNFTVNLRKKKRNIEQFTKIGLDIDLTTMEF